MRCADQALSVGQNSGPVQYTGRHDARAGWQTRSETATHAEADDCAIRLNHPGIQRTRLRRPTGNRSHGRPGDDPGLELKPHNCDDAGTGGLGQCIVGATGAGGVPRITELTGAAKPMHHQRRLAGSKATKPRQEGTTGTILTNIRTSEPENPIRPRRFDAGA